MHPYLREIKRVIKYLLYPKKYYNGVEICGQFAEFMAQFITDRMQVECPKGKLACFNTYSVPTVLHYHRAPIKLFWTQENTHVQGSEWQKFENIYLKESSLALTLGFDYAQEDTSKYMRFPYWLERLFGALATKEDITRFVQQHNCTDPSKRFKKCAFICKKDYFGDRALIADMVAQVMPISYPSDFRHNDDDLRGKYYDDKIAYLRQFRFNLCPENSNDRGYVTEKIFEAIAADCIPIYWGNEGYPEPDILNPKAIVYLDKDNPTEGLALLQRLCDDPKALADFATQPRFMQNADDVIYSYYEQLEVLLNKVKVLSR